MKKPLVASSFFSFPKLLLWSLPLAFFLVFTWLIGGLNKDTLKLLAWKTEEVVIEKLHRFSSTPAKQLHDSSFTPDVVLRVTEQPLTQSCITKANAVLVNGTSPGPEIRLVEGQVHWIRVYNDMDAQNLTMHWHGLSMAVSPFSDGTPAASQWPIPPHHFFDYELQAPVGMAGTYFYHSHIGFQAVTAGGALIVDDAAKPPYEYDEERIIALSDIFEKTDEEIESGLTSIPFVWSGETANVLVNGKGQMQGSPTSAGCELASIDVEPEKVYRFRFIGGTALSFVSLGIEDHDELTIIETDGSYTKPVNTSYLQIGSGQRFSVLLRTKAVRELSKNQFFMQIETRDRPTFTRSYAVLNYRYRGSRIRRNLFPNEAPVALPPTTLGWLDQQLESLLPDPEFPGAAEVTRRVTIRTHWEMDSAGAVFWAQDLTPWLDTFPTEPYLVSLYKNNSIDFPSYERAVENGGIDPVTKAFPAKIGEVIEIVIQNTASDGGGLDAHPFHAHGSHYWDLGSGRGTYDPVKNEEKVKGVQLVRRDTTMLYKYGEKVAPGEDMGWRAWRLRVTEPGVWMVHCHILQHMIMGMQTVWVFGNASEILKVPVEYADGYMTYGGSANGNKTHDPSPIHFKGLWWRK